MKTVVLEKDSEREREVTFEKLRTWEDAEATKVLLQIGDIYVKVYATRLKRRFGSIGWTLSGSHCDETGKALRDSGVPRAMTDALDKWIISIASNTPEDVETVFDAGLAVIAERVAIAVSNERRIARATEGETNAT